MLGRATGKLSNDGSPTENITLVRVLTVPRLPGVPVMEGDPPPAIEAPVAESRVIDAPVDSDTADITPRNSR